MNFDVINVQCQRNTKSGKRCSATAATRVQIGCKHEHICMAWSCLFHANRALDGHFVCQECSRIDGHSCAVSARLIES